MDKENSVGIFLGIYVKLRVIIEREIKEYDENMEVIFY